MVTLAVVDALDEPQRTEVDAFLSALAEERSHPALSDAKLVHLHAGGEGFVVLAHDGRLAGVAVGLRPSPDPEAPVWNVQEAAPAGGGVREDLARAVVAEAWRRGASRVQWWAAMAGPSDDELAQRLGLAPWRDVVQLRRPLPPPSGPTLPAGVKVRPFQPGSDDAEWLAVNRRAFAEHPEQRSFTGAALSGRMAEPWFDASDFLVAEDATGMVGFCWVKIPAPTHGEIYVIGVDPRARGSGLGKALVLEGMDRMVERGVPEARLYTDGANDTALALYESLGFTRHHVDRAYAADSPS